MSKILVKTKHGLYVREATDENAGNAENVHPNKLLAWASFGQAAHDAAGKTMEDVVEAVAAEMTNVKIKPEKERTAVSKDEYEDLILQGIKKGIKKEKIDLLVVVREMETEDQESKKLKLLLRVE